MVGLFGYCNHPLIESLDKLVKKDGKVEMEEKFCSVALDIIGKSVFNYEFGSVTDESPVVRAVYSALVEAEHRSMVRQIMSLFTFTPARSYDWSICRHRHHIGIYRLPIKWSRGCENSTQI